MATTLDTPRPNPWRTRLALVLVAVLCLGGFGGFEVYALRSVHDHEQAVLNGLQGCSYLDVRAMKSAMYSADSSGYWCCGPCPASG